MSDPTFFDETYKGVGWYTAAELKALLDRVPPHAMICTGDGHVRRVISEPNSNEPYVFLGNAP